MKNKKPFSMTRKELKRAEEFAKDEAKQNEFKKLISLAMLEESRNNRKKALRYSEKAVKLNLRNAILMWQTGSHYKVFDNIKKAEKYFSTAIKINPFDIVCVFEEIFALRELKRDKEALEILDNYIKINPSHKKVVDFRRKFARGWQENEKA